MAIRRKNVALLILLLVSALAIAITFHVDFNRDFGPTGAFTTMAQVNETPAIVAWAHLPVNNRKTITIVYENGAKEKYFVQSSASTAPLVILPGTYVPPPSAGGGGACGTPGQQFDPSFRPFEPGCGSPILIDLEKNGIHLGNAGVGVSFDIFGSGVPVHMQWVEPLGGEAFLAIDLNHNGVIDDGSELFGQGTRMILEGGTPAPNGFVGLAQYDEPQLGGNGDGTLTPEDQAWNGLILWLDHNADSISTEDEILQLSDIALIALDVTPKENNRRDPAGNWLPLWSWAEADAKPKKMKMVDVFFRRLEE